MPIQYTKFLAKAQPGVFISLYKKFYTWVFKIHWFLCNIGAILKPQYKARAAWQK